MSGDRRDVPDFIRDAEDADEELDVAPLGRLPELLEGAAPAAARADWRRRAMRRAARSTASGSLPSAATSKSAQASGARDTSGTTRRPFRAGSARS